jgi:mono/diheme cytochrome c family protein
MNVPVPVRLAVLAVGATFFYAYVGQLVPQKEVQAPVVVEIDKSLSPTEMAEVGKEIFNGKGICSTCHTLGKSGALRFPDLEGVAVRAATRIPGHTALDYFAESLYEPDKYLVPGFNPGMPTINKPPISLTDDEILTVIAYLESLGGTPNVTMETKLVYTGGALGGGEGGGETGTEALAEAAAPESPAVAAAATDGLLAASCGSCHLEGSTDAAKGATFAELAGRLSKEQIIARTAAHAPPLPNAAQITLADVQKIADSVSKMRGEG